MLKKKQRLTKKEFNHFFSIGKRYHHPFLQLIYSPSNSFHGVVVVGKKVYKNAVDRNKLRRQIYNILYREQKHTHLAGTFIFITKPNIKNESKDDISKCIKKMIQHTK